MRVTRRTGDGTFSADFPRQVAFAEQRINYGQMGVMPSDPLRVRGMEKTVRLNVDAGSAVLPVDYLAPKRLTWDADIALPLRYVTPNEFWDLRWGGLQPQVFTVEGGTLYHGPAQSGTLVLTYFAKFKALETEDRVVDRTGSAVLNRSDVIITQRLQAQSNWLMMNAPSVVMSAVLIESYKFLRNAVEEQKAYGDFMSSIAGLNSSEGIARVMRTPAPRIRGATIR